MIDYKYSFVTNNMEGDMYVLVMSCWYVDTEGQRVNVKSETHLNQTLAECLTLSQAFVIPE